MPIWKPATDEELETQIAIAEERGREAEASEPRAVAVRYEEKADRIIIEMQTGCAFMFPPGIAQGLAVASASELSKVEIVLGGEALEWPALGVGFTVLGLMTGVFGGKAWMREHFAQNGRKGGHSTSDAKRSAARENGKKGGRPRKAAF